MNEKQIKEYARILGKRGGDKIKATMPPDYYKTIIKKRWDAYRALKARKQTGGLAKARNLKARKQNAPLLQKSGL